MSRFYNTTAESGAKLAEYRSKAARQEEIIYKFFAVRNELSPINIEAMTGFPRTSIARALRNLVLDGRLEKLEDRRVPGRYGRPEHVWRVVNKKGQLGLFQ